MVKYIFIFFIIFSIYYLLNKNIIIIKENFNNNNYTAIIIEPRKHLALEFVLTNFLENLSNEWNIIIFHGTNNKLYIENIINNKLLKYKSRIKLENLNVDNLSLKEYNKLLTSKEIYDKIPTEIFLIFQTDSLICSDYKDIINYFLKYDYVGAPWKFNNVGNGGLSLRKKSKMLEIINKCNYNNKPEDYYFTQSCNNLIYRNLPTVNEAKNFSMEGIYNDISFGIHKPWAHLNEEKIINKEKYCKGLLKLKELNKNF
jgi:hypothetical protein